jgi:exonuclease SbcC
MSAFGPYAGEQEIDFRNLGERSFFLIHGATGAGKTTVLDAICFALYGSTTGEERTGRQMRSDLAQPQTMTEVFLDFSLGREQYRIHRIPEHEVVRRNKTVTQKAQATLWKRSAVEDGDDATDGELITAGWKEVTKAIETLLGFQRDQFRQVVVLPQGQFRRLLIATSKERETILETLFRTEYFRNAELALKQAAGTVTDAIKQVTRERETQLTMLGVESQQELFTKHEQVRLDLEKTRNDLTRWQGVLSAAHKAFGEAKTNADKLQASADAQVELAVLENQRDLIEERRQELQGAQKAAQLADVRQALTAQAQAEEKAHGDLLVTKDMLAAGEKRLAEAEAAFAEEETRGEARTQAQETLRSLQAMSEQVFQLDAVGKEVKDLERQVAQATTALDTTTAEIEKRTTQLDALRAKCLQASQAETQLATLEARVRDLGRRLETARKLATVTESIDASRQDLEDAEQDVARHEKLIAKSHEELSAMENAWAAGQAAVLARGLEEGDACPVCGSCKHPHKARAAKDLPTEASLIQHRQRCRSLEAERDAKRAIAGQKQQQLSANQTLQEELTRQLADGAVSVSSLSEALAEASAQLDKVRSAMIMHADLSSRLETAQSYMTNLDDTLKADRLRLSQANDAWREKRGVLAQLETGIKPEYRDAALLKNQIRSARQMSEQLQQAFELAQQELHSAREALTGIRAQLDAATKTLASEKKRLTEAQALFDEKLRNCGFASETEFEACQREARILAELEEMVQDFDVALKAAQERSARAREAARDIQAPDLVALQTAVDEAQECCNNLLKEETHLSRDLTDLEACSKRLEQLEDKFGDLEEKYRVVGTIAEVANGDNQLNVTFQRFVLGALLDDVLIAATQRLNIMSKGRYYLQRSMTTQDGRKTGGLDLEVTDTFTGTSRNVATLSGGESFLASLSLALGLADVVQSYAGGIHLDTIFVDEGFGTLDPEALDLALRALIDLQRTGRLVGIISHVPELKERIDARLEIVSGRHGSNARFVVA